MEDTEKYLGYIKNIYELYGSHIVVCKDKGDRYKIIFPKKCYFIFTSKEEFFEFEKWLTIRITRECIIKDKKGNVVLNYIALEKMCREGRDFEQVYFDKRLLKKEEIKELVYDISMFQRGKRKVCIDSKIEYEDFTEEEVYGEIEKINFRIARINEKYNSDLPQFEAKKIEE